MQNYSVEVARDELSVHLRAAYTRARRNLKRARRFSKDQSWLWGERISPRTYNVIDWEWQQVTGELTNLGKFYRNQDYHACSNLQKSKLDATFSKLIYDKSILYLDNAIDICKLPSDNSQAEIVIICDKIKQYMLALFHAVQYPLRKDVTLPNTIPLANLFAEAAASATRAFYLALLGHDNSMILRELEGARRLILESRLRNHINHINPQYFKAQELDQPLTILYAALLALERHPYVDILYALPSGGTQLAIVVQLLYRLRDRAQPKLYYLPTSPRQIDEQTGRTIRATTSATIRLLKKSQPKNKRVLLCEDNSNTGTTLTLMAETIRAFSPQSFAAILGEFDPERMRIKHLNQSMHIQVTNCLHSDFDNTVGIVPIYQEDDRDIQLRKAKPLALYYNKANGNFVPGKQRSLLERSLRYPLKLVLSITKV